MPPRPLAGPDVKNNQIVAIKHKKVPDSTLRCVTRGTLILEQDWHMILLCPTNIETIWYHSFFSTLNLQPAPSKRVFAYLLTLGH